MVQSYLKKVGHRTFTANKKGGNREFFPHFPSPFAFLIATTKNCHVGIAISTHGLKESKQLFWRQFAVSDDADFIPPAIENRASISIVHCPIVHLSPPFGVTVPPPLGDNKCRFRVIAHPLFVGKYYHIQAVFFVSKLWLVFAKRRKLCPP